MWDGPLEDLALKGEKLIAELRTKGVAVIRQSRFHTYIKSLRDFAAQPASNDLMPAALRAVGEIDNLYRISQALLRNAELPGARAAIRKILSGHTSRAAAVRDTEFELLIASMLREVGYEVRLEEPDIAVHTEAGWWSIAAKRPRSLNKLRHRVHLASKQIEKSGRIGIVAVDLSCVVNPQEAQISTADFRAAYRDAGSALVAFVREREAFFKWSVHNTVAGVIAHNAVPVWQPSGLRLGYVNRWVVAALHPDENEMAVILRNMQKRLQILQPAG
jgi:hypothetical protein